MVRTLGPVTILGLADRLEPSPLGTLALNLIAEVDGLRPLNRGPPPPLLPLLDRRGPR